MKQGIGFLFVQRNDKVHYSAAWFDDEIHKNKFNIWILALTYISWMVQY